MHTYVMCVNVLHSYYPNTVLYRYFDLDMYIQRSCVTITLTLICLNFPLSIYIFVRLYDPYSITSKCMHI